HRAHNPRQHSLCPLSRPHRLRVPPHHRHAPQKNHWEKHPPRLRPHLARYLVVVGQTIFSWFSQGSTAHHPFPRTRRTVQAARQPRAPGHRAFHRRRRSLVPAHRFRRRHHRRRGRLSRSHLHSRNSLHPGSHHPARSGRLVSRRQ